jgi:hypothetical protein
MTGEGTPDADRHRASRGGNRAREERERERHDGRGADALERAGGDERPGAGREGGSDRREAEERDPGDEHPTPAEPVAERRGGDHEARERERVGVDHPLQLLERGAQLGAQDRQGGGHDEVVEGGHEHRQGGGDQGEAGARRAAAAGRRFRAAGGESGHRGSCLLASTDYIATRPRLGID